MGVIRRQFPIAAAEAVTIHKSQGQTYDYVMVVLPPRGRGLKRVLLPPPPPEITSPLAIELARHDFAEVSLTPRFAFLHENRGNVYQFMFHNVQSLRKHLGLIQQDEVYLSSDFLLFAETWTVPEDTNEQLAINGFQLVTQQNSNSSNLWRPSDTCCYVKDSICEYLNRIYSYFQNTSITVPIILFTGPLLIAAIYASP
ncbi:hypothetical protein BJV82DRAFT_665816 [Fennellomyces sp. T-0311]|nr:hypothetical protein BJV82DRAFT_665816 [Fennellomyces sp. T-0311]